MNPIEQGFQLIEMAGVWLMFAWIAFGAWYAIDRFNDWRKGITKADRQRDELARYRNASR